jgi:hypothetical protein
VKRALLFVAVLLSGCTMIGEERVEGWPELQIVEHYVPHHVMRERCMKYVPLLMSPEACAEFDFVANRCDLWFSADFPPAEHLGTQQASVGSSVRPAPSGQASGGL